MEAESELQLAYNDVLLKAGRNLRMFQIAEHCLKYLLKMGNITMVGQDPPDFDTAGQPWRKQTMGQTKNQFVDKHCGPLENPLGDFSPHPKSPSMAMTFTMGDADYAKVRQSAISMLVEERNKLVHHFFEDLDPSSLPGCHEAAVRLDAQRELALPEVKRLQQDCRNVRESYGQLLASLPSEWPQGTDLS